MRTELDNIHSRYTRREKADSGIYDPTSPAVYMSQQELGRKLAWWVDMAGMRPVSERKVLEIGCGTGGNLLQFLKMGFVSTNLFGIDLLEDRVLIARSRLPVQTQIVLGDACTLDFPAGYFDVVMQATVFSSVLDDAFQKKLANRMWELTKPGGGILWYDFIMNNPRNKDVRGVPVSRIQELFPAGAMTVRKLTLAPPISRLVTKAHPSLYTFFNFLPILRTHVLCWIKKPQQERT